jgi:hypothetical protein
MSNWREMQALVMADEQARRDRWKVHTQTHRPWLDDSQPDELWKRNEERADAKRTNQGQFLAWALLLVSLVIGGGAAYVISVLAARAYDHAMDAQQRAYCQQLQMAQAPSMPEYCNGEGK